MIASRLVLAWSLTAVALYACVLPLWEGWDEPFHYAYVQALAVNHELPVIGTTTVSQEIADSFTRTPLPGFFAQAVPGSVSFQQWHALPGAARDALHKSLGSIAPGTRLRAGPNPNYEAHQAPLAYLLLALPDLLLAHWQLLTRVLALRLVLAVTSMFFVFAGLLRLARTLAIAERPRHALLFCSLSVQVLWASLAHIGNDAVAIPLTLWFLAFLAEGRTLVGLAILLSAGLLAKAYFLCFVPVFIAFCVVSARRRKHSWRNAALAMLLVALLAGPWYARNLRHGTLSGTLESGSGVTLEKVLVAVPQIPWMRGGFLFLRNTLWLGNWSYSAFSRGPITALLVLAAVAFILYFRNWKSIGEAEVWLWSAIGCFGGALLYQTGAAYVHTQGQTLTVDSWYWQGVVLAIWVLLFRALQACGVVGRVVMGACCLVTAYVAAATFLTMLLPEYGAGLAKASLAAKWHWWRTDAFADIARVTLAPAQVVLFLLCLFLSLLLLNLFFLVRNWNRGWS